MGKTTWTFAVVLVLFALPACNRTEDTDANARVYQVRGIVRGFAPDRSTVHIQHEDIPGFMPSMTMPFAAREPKEIAGLKVGDAIAFRVRLTEKGLLLDQVRKIESGEVRIAEATPAATVASRPEARLKEGEIVPFFTLTNQDGARLTSEDFRGHPYVLTFVFTRCPVPNFCPRISHNFSQVEEGIKSDSKLAGTRLLSITIDPGFDRREILKAYGEHLQADFGIWSFATGEPAQIDRLTQNFAVLVQPESGTISHGLATALVGSDGTIIKIWRGNSWQATEVIDELRKL
jgi:protein SCO1/2